MNASDASEVDDVLLASSPWRSKTPGLVCECSSAACSEEIVLPRATYESARAWDRRFIVCPGHVEQLGDRVIDRYETFWVVDKSEPGAAGSPDGHERGRALRVALIRAVVNSRRIEREYHEAHLYYVALMRHRLANPITAICGFAQTLCEHPELDSGAQLNMLRSIVDECRRVLDVDLEPHALDDAERGLDAALFGGHHAR